MIKGKTKMKCLECGNEKFTVKDVPETVDFKGLTITVSTPSYVCDSCNFTLTDTEQMNAFRRAVSDKYRQIKGLLTSEEIKAYRNRLDMSQEQFADYLKVGVASIKRWETYFIQDESQDDHIRLKCENNELIDFITSIPSINTGYKRFDFQLIKNVILRLIPVFKSPLFINKALFYADFLHYKKYQKGITGLTYCSLNNGPCPDNYGIIFKILLEKGDIAKDGGFNLLGLKETDDYDLANTEVEVIDQILQIGEQRGANFIFELSHKEPAYLKNCKDFKKISYKDAQSLKISKYVS